MSEEGVKRSNWFAGVPCAGSDASPSTSACTSGCNSPFIRRSSNSFTSKPTMNFGNGLNGSGLADIRAQLDFLGAPGLDDREQSLHLKRVRSLASSSRRLKKNRSDRLLNHNSSLSVQRGAASKNTSSLLRRAYGSRGTSPLLESSVSTSAAPKAVVAENDYPYGCP